MEGQRTEEEQSSETQPPRHSWLRQKAADRCKGKFTTREAAQQIIKATIDEINDVRFRRTNVYRLANLPFLKGDQQQSFADYFSANGLNNPNRHIRTQNPDWTQSPNFRLTTLLRQISDIIGSEEPMEIVIDQIFSTIDRFSKEDHRPFWEILKRHDITILFEELILNERPEYTPILPLLYAATFRRSIMSTLTNTEN